MQKVLAIGAATARHAPVSTEGRVVEFPGASERTGRTFVCSVLFLDIVEYSKKPIGDQLQTKERFNAQVSQAIAEVPPEDRIILDTGDGVAISFLGDPEDTLCVALALAPAFSASAAIPTRIGINLGPVRLTRDINGQPNIIGDGINVAQRVMSFARPGQILVSRGYHEAVTRIAEDYAALFAYQGSRTDKHVREHEIFELVAPLEQASELARQRKQVRQRKSAAAQTASGPRLLSHRGLAYAVTACSSVLLIAAMVSTFQAEAPPKPVSAAVTLPRSAAPVPAKTPLEPIAQATPEPPAAPAPPTPTALAQPKVASMGKSATTSHAASAPQVVAIPAPREPSPESSGSGKSAGPGYWKPETPASAAKTSAGPTALVVLAISPWGEVFVDGKSMGVSPPLAEMELTPGKHRVVVRNGSFKPFQDDVDLGSNETVRIKHKFVQPR
jgi:class 3 adenylate cyclase